MVIVACNTPSVQPFPVAPAVLAPALYTETVLEFLHRGRLETPPVTLEMKKPDRDGEVKTGTRSSETASPRRQRRHNGRYAWKDLEAQAKEYSNNRVRRGAVIPGTRASRRPNEPTPCEAFVIKVEDGVIFLELVAHACGAGKGVFRLAVQGVGHGRERDGGSGGEAAGVRPARFGTTEIPVVAESARDLDGVHGAPVFLGGRLFGFALQVRGVQTFSARLSLKILSLTIRASGVPCSNGGR